MTETPVFKINKPTVSGDADAWGGQLNENADDLEIFLARPRFKKVAPTVGATTTLDFGVGNFFEFTIGQTTTLVISNVPATLPDTTVPVTRGFLKITNGGAFTITWPAAIVWPFETSNAAPTGLAVSGVDVIEIVTYDAGTTWYAILHHIKTSPNLDPRVSVYKTANQSLSTAEVTLTFDAERFDVGGMHDNVTNNSRLTVPANQGGLYHILADVQINSASSAQLILRKNGSVIREQQPIEERMLHLSVYEVLAAGDFVELSIDTGGFPIAQGGITKTSFAMARVR